MTRLASIICVLFPAHAVGQDPMTAMAMAAAGQMASVAAKKGEELVEKKMSEPSVVTPCVGAQCCQASSCRNMPGLGCSRDRGYTTCVGAAGFESGTCACIAGECSIDGKCRTIPTDEQIAAARAPPPTAAPQAAFQQPAAVAPAAPAASGAAAGASAGASPAASPAVSSDTFSRWHVPGRLYTAPEPDATRASPFKDAGVLLGVAAVSIALFAVALAARNRRLDGELLRDLSAGDSGSEDSPEQRLILA